jgi:hypothetical protein
MVQLAKGNKAAIRKYIIGRAKALGLSDAIPDHWNADGTVGSASSSNLASKSSS